MEKMRQFHLCLMIAVLIVNFRRSLGEELDVKHEGDSSKEPEFQFATVTKITNCLKRPSDKRTENAEQFEINMDNETFTVTLYPNRDLFIPECLVHNYLPFGEKDIHPCSQERMDCYYTGSSDLHNESWVAANICNGLNGMISHGNTSLFIEPLNSNISTDGNYSNVHVVYRFQGYKRHCAVEASPLHIVAGRDRREIRTRYIRTRLVVDPTMFHYHKTHEHTIAFIMTAFNIASKLYADPSIGAKIHLTLSEIHIVKTYNDFASELTEDANMTLETFCKWQGEDSKFKLPSDCSVLLTRMDLETNDGDKSINGLSYSSSVCKHNLHCAVIEDEGPIMGVTMAHEIGHVLGLTHDTGKVGIMSPGGWSGGEAFTWSAQSARELQSSIRSGSTSCLQERLGRRSGDGYTFPPPGTLFTADQQCKMRNDNNYIHFQNNTEDPCIQIKCRYKDQRPFVTSTPLTDGTDCNNTRTWCIKGKCVPIDSEHASLSPINGEWSDWDAEYTRCSRSCGGGVQIKRRRCDNPPPQYGGKVCQGKQSKVKLCNIQPCTSDFRSSQCDELRRWNASADSQRATQTWTPALGYIGDDSCIIRCNDGQGHVKSRSVNTHYADGTECLSNSPVAFSRCVQGKCLVFGCDGHAGSGLKYDVCGVCNGTGSTCGLESGNYSHNELPKIYTNVTEIPEGSSHITIIQRNKYAFLSILVDGRRILNTNNDKSFSAIFNLYGIQFRYTRKPETIQIVGKIPKPIVIQVFRLYDYKKYYGVTPEISYSYYVPNSVSEELFAWAEEPSQRCSVSCGTGVKSVSIRCMSMRGEFVEDFHCDISTKPAERYMQCNRQACPPRWKKTEWGSCSVLCGEGKKVRSVTCVQTINKIEHVQPLNKCDRWAMPTNMSRCRIGCEWQTGPWSECSRTCGEGYRIRRLSCFHTYGNRSKIDDKLCNQLTRPDDTQRCKPGPCYVLDGKCVDKKADCHKYYIYDTTACDGSYKTWMTTNCIKTCGICANGSCVDEDVCKRVDPSVDPCHSYGYWMKHHCPQTCNICQDCADCSNYDVRYCTDPQYVEYMKRTCSKTCKFCQ